MMVAHRGPPMTPEEHIAETIKILEDSLATDFLTDSVRDIMTRAVEHLKAAQSS